MKRTFPRHSLGDSGYNRLLYAILEPTQLFCKDCHHKISETIRCGGTAHNLCADCLRERGRLRQHAPHPRAGSRRTIAQREYPAPNQCQVKGCDKVGIRHHEDYDKPREIIWLCRSHHALLHNGNLTRCDKI